MFFPCIIQSTVNVIVFRGHIKSVKQPVVTHIRLRGSSEVIHKLSKANFLISERNRIQEGTTTFLRKALRDVKSPSSGIGECN